jgi:release factor glutamine methyltransferase
MTLREALAEGRTRLQAAGVADASLDARLLLAAATKLDMASLIARDREALPADASARYESYMARRASGEPIARILDEASFWGLAFKLNAATLVPRPDTETLVETVLECARALPPDIVICDLGTGSGAIVVALLSELPEARAVATDISDAALEIARANAEMHGVAERIRFACVDFADGPRGPFDVVVANPPYIRSSAIEGLPREVRVYDPRAALDGGKDGLDAYRVILARAGRLLRSGGVLAFEVGYDQGESVAALCRGAELSEVAVRRDLAGRERVVIARATLSEAGVKAAKKALGKVG